MKEHRFIVMFICSIFLFPYQALGLDYSIKGQLSGWTTESNIDDEWQNQSGVRYIPQLTLEQSLWDGNFFDVEVSGNGYWSYDTQTEEDDSDIELYRLKFRFATLQTDTRIGLQKINFGPAQLLRSLQWFDKLDPRDPQKFTDGVWGLRFRYYAMNNANLWLWALYGNDQRKGMEIFPSLEDELELGGRFQYPIFSGELAATFHTRKVDAPEIISDYRENRYALDGRWDVVIGLWFEAVLQQQDIEKMPYEWTKFATLGADYTFGIGNGIHVLGEHMLTGIGEEILDFEEDQQVSAISVNYPMGLFDNFQAMGYYLWDFEKYLQYYSWQRTYDSFSLNLSFFHYPEIQETMEITNFSGNGYGAQLMIIYYH